MIPYQDDPAAYEPVKRPPLVKAVKRGCRFERLLSHVTGDGWYRIAEYEYSPGVKSLSERFPAYELMSRKVIDSAPPKWAVWARRKGDIDV